MRHGLCLLFTAAALAAASLAGAAPRAASAPVDRPVAIAATTAMIADIARAVGADRVEVDGLLGPGVDPHLYKLTRSDIARLSNADLVLYNGLLLEGKMTDAFVRLASSGKPVVAVTQEIDEDRLLTPEQFQGHFDPHVWMDPASWTACIAVVRDSLTRIDPAHAADYAARAESYAAELSALDSYAAGVLATVPESSRVLVTAHDAFNYFGRRYGFEVLGIQGISTESEAGVREIERLVDLLVTRRISAVFVETTVSDRSVRALIDGARARGHTVVIGGSLFSDAMGDPGSYEGTYVGMIDHNVTTIARALGGEAPQRGMRGLLAAPGAVR